MAKVLPSGSRDQTGKRNRVTSPICSWTGGPSSVAGLAPLAGGGAVLAQDAATPGSATLSSCLLSPEMTEGPDYLNDMLVRQDIADGKAGVPLEQAMTVIDAETCAPIANAAVEIWHRDANGFYFGFVDSSPGGQADDGTYEGGTTAQTGQIGFDDAITDFVVEIEPYATRTSTFLPTTDDGIFAPHLDDESVFVRLEQVNPEAVADGLRGTILLDIDPASR